MNKAEASAYRDRWREVEEIERHEAQAATIQDRWRQLNAIKFRATRLGIKREKSECEYYSLWAKLKNTHASSQQ